MGETYLRCTTLFHPGTISKACINQYDRKEHEQFQTLTAVYTIFRDGSVLRVAVPLTSLEDFSMTAEWMTSIGFLKLVT